MKTCGLDVHKDSIFCAIYDGLSSKGTSAAVKEFTTLTSDIRAMGKYLLDNEVHQIAMESTGIYWIPVWNILEDLGFELMLVNPLLVKALPGRKSDVKDSGRIAGLLYKGLLGPSLVPCDRIRALRSYSRKCRKLQGRLPSCMQEMEKLLIMCSIRISSFVSNITSKTMIRVIEQLIAGESNPEKLAELVHGRIIKKGKEKIIESLKGFVCEHHRDLLALAMEEYKVLLHQQQECMDKMKAICEKDYQQEFELLQTIPGINEIGALLILAETGADMKAFENSGKLVGWVGLRPRNDESAGKYKSRAITKGNQHLRTILVQCAWAAV